MTVKQELEEMEKAQKAFVALASPRIQDLFGHEFSESLDKAIEDAGRVIEEKRKKLNFYED